MTIATVCFGIWFILGGLLSVLIQGIFGLMGVFQLVFGIVMCCVYCKQENVALRKCICYAYIVYCVVLVISWILYIVLILVIDLSEFAGDDRRSR